MNLLIDECLSPLTALELSAHGHYAIHPRNQGGVGDPDDDVMDRATHENLVVVTENGKDYRKIAGERDIHPGVIILPCTTRERSKALLLAAIEYLEGVGDPSDVMVNHILDVSEGAGGETLMDFYPLSA